MVDLNAIEIDREVLNLIPKATAAELSVLPLALENGTIVVALPEGSNGSVSGDLEFLLGRRVRVERVADNLLTEAIRKHYGITDLEARRHGHASAREFVSVKEADREQSDFTPARDTGSADSSVVTLANRIISDAIRMGASDIHVEPYERTIRVRYRLDGVLHEVLRPPLAQAKALISRLKIMADLDIAEKRRPQDGRIRVKEDERTIDIRVSSLPTDFGEKMVLRILDKSQLQLDLMKLGLEPDDLRRFQRTVKLPYGMILVTGPTGSGKTTTLYAALNYINAPDINITTIEDPIEYNLPGINQTHVRSEIGLTFAAALRSILRQDPNVIMVGEIRDGETAEIAIRAALTGHLVFSTLHTNDAPSAITRLVDMGVEPFLVASSVKMILAQRLLRRLCEKCKTRSDPTPDQVEGLGVTDSARAYYSPKGCGVCHRSGYAGRTAVYEVLSIHNGLSEMIARGATASEIREMARTSGFRSLRDVALQKAAAGQTSLAEVLRETSG